MNIEKCDGECVFLKLCLGNREAGVCCLRRNEMHMEESSMTYLQVLPRF